MTKKWWAEYDLDGSYTIKFSEPYLPYGHHLGPFNSFSEAKNHLIWALRDCRNELNSAISEVKRLRKGELDGQQEDT